jgi:membrane-associated HD superfamily phosphohydrolase
MDKIDEILNAKIDIIMQMVLVKPEKKSSIIQSHSPLSLTDYGKQLIYELNVENYLSENWEYISKYITENSKSMNPYDIQQLCFNFIIVNAGKILTQEGYEKLKLKAFNLGIPDGSLLQGVSLVIRDRYFQECNIDLEEIDKNSPQK